MADFNTSLAAPQAAGAAPVAPVQTQQVPFSPDPLLHGIVDIFAKGLVADNKQKAEERKKNVIGEYIQNEQIYSDALSQGTWNASMVGTASRANFTKMLAAYPEYVTELTEAKKSVYDGTEVGQAQKQVDEEIKLYNADKERASQMGYTFYTGMSKELEMKMIDSSKTTVRVQRETEEGYRRNAELRAAASEGRAVENHVIQMQNYQDKENATKGLLTIADKNFDTLGSLGKDLMDNPSMTFEQKQLIYNENVSRIKTGMLAIASTNPELARPWQQLVEDMQSTFIKIADPKAKAEGELASLKTLYDSQQYKAKLLVTSDPKVRNAVAITSLFPNNPTLLTLATDPVLVSVLADYGLGPSQAGGQKTPVVGQPNEKKALNTIKGALKSLSDGTAVGEKAKLGNEAVNTVNEVLRQNATMQGPISAPMLKDLGAFYSSPEFGKLAAEGQLDSATMQNVKNVFTANYEPVVIGAIQNRLEQVELKPSVKDMGNAPGKKLYETVDIRFNGSGVSFVDKPGTSRTLSTMVTKNNLEEAASGLNSLIRMGAHMEGTTNYAAYWEANKHYLLPSVFPDPVKLKPGQVVDGYEYTGGAYRDRSNWKRVK